MFKTVIVRDVPQGNAYIEYRKVLLQTIQNATAGHWNISNEDKNILMIFDMDLERFSTYLNRQLVHYRESAMLPDGSPIILESI